MHGHIAAMFVCPGPGELPIAMDEVVIESGRGIVGDRYWSGTGTFSRWGGIGGEGRAISLIEAEATDAIFVETGINLRAGQHRRNIVTRNILLSDLVGMLFKIGPVTLRGTRVCTECRYLDRITQQPISTALHNRPGLRADVIHSGTVRVGDVLVLI